VWRESMGSLGASGGDKELVAHAGKLVKVIGR
jgi:hypothetical protein